MAFPWHPGKRKPRQKRYKRRKIGGCLSNRRGDSRIARRFRPLPEGAVKCVAFDWGRDFFVALPPSFACGKSHLPLRGRGYGAPSRRPLRSHFSLPVPRPNLSPAKNRGTLCKCAAVLFFSFHATRPSFFAVRRTNSSRAAIANKKPNSAPAATSDRKCRPIIKRVKPNSQV